MSWYVFLIITHLAGTIIGVGAATLAEAFSFKVARSGKFDETAASFLKTTYFFIRLGLIIVILSGVGFLILYRFSGGPDLLSDDRFLAKMTIVLVIVFNPILMQWKVVPTSVGGPVSLVSWWSAVVLGAWRGLGADYFVIMAVYLLALIAGVAALAALRKSLENRVQSNN